MVSNYDRVGVTEQRGAAAGGAVSQQHDDERPLSQNRAFGMGVSAEFHVHWRVQVRHVITTKPLEGASWDTIRGATQTNAEGAEIHGLIAQAISGCGLRWSWRWSGATRLR